MAAFIGRAGVTPGSVGLGLESATAAFIGWAGVRPGSVQLGLERAMAAFIGRAGVMSRVCRILIRVCYDSIHRTGGGHARVCSI